MVGLVPDFATPTSIHLPLAPSPRETRRRLLEVAVTMHSVKTTISSPCHLCGCSITHQEASDMAVTAEVEAKPCMGKPPLPPTHFCCLYFLPLAHLSHGQPHGEGGSGGRSWQYQCKICTGHQLLVATYLGLRPESSQITIQNQRGQSM